MKFATLLLFCALASLGTTSCDSDENPFNVDISLLEGKWSILTVTETVRILGSTFSSTITYEPNFLTFTFDQDEILQIAVIRGEWDSNDYTLSGDTISYLGSIESFPVPFTITFEELTPTTIKGTLSYSDPLFSSQVTQTFSGTRNTGMEPGILLSDLVGSWNIAVHDEFENSQPLPVTVDNVEGEDIQFNADGTGSVGDPTTGDAIQFEMLDRSNILLTIDTNGNDDFDDEEELLIHVTESNGTTLLELVSYKQETDSNDQLFIYRDEFELVKN